MVGDGENIETQQKNKNELNYNIRKQDKKKDSN